MKWADFIKRYVQRIINVVYYIAADFCQNCVSQI